MSLDKSGIEHIQKTGNPVVDIKAAVPIAAVAEGYEIKNLEKYQENPSRFRGCFATEIIGEFHEYIEQQAMVKCFINTANMTAKAFFDLGDEDAPGHGEHRASLMLVKLSPYAAMCSINETAMSQRKLAEWLEDWRDYAVGLNADDEIIDIKKVISAIRSITVTAKSESETTEKNLGYRASGLEELDIKNDEGNMPVYIRFTCQPYEGLGERVFKLRLGVITNRNEKPEVVLRAAQFEKAKEEMAIEFKDILLERLDKESTFIGNFEIK